MSGSTGAVHWVFPGVVLWQGLLDEDVEGEPQDQVQGDQGRVQEDDIQLCTKVQSHCCEVQPSEKA